ncbi:2211_t:CDS:2, partial [Funneliformis mosseae]
KISDDETNEGYNKFIKEYRSRYEWDNEENPEFIPECLLSVRNPISLFHIKVDDNADEVDNFRYRLLLQGEDSIVNYYSKIKRCNNVIKLYKNHLREIFHKGLSLESQRYIARFRYYYDHDLDPDKMVEMLIQVEKENVPDFITAFSDYLSQANDVQILTQSGFSNNNFISAFLNLELTRPSMTRLRLRQKMVQVC